jgi:hypothetical protein
MNIFPLGFTCICMRFLFLKRMRIPTHGPARTHILIHLKCFLCIISGFSAVDVTTNDGTREGTYTAFLEPIFRRRNVKIYRNARVTKVKACRSAYSSKLKPTSYVHIPYIYIADQFGFRKQSHRSQLRPFRATIDCNCKKGGYH